MVWSGFVSSRPCHRRGPFSSGMFCTNCHLPVIVSLSSCEHFPCWKSVSVIDCSGTVFDMIRFYLFTNRVIWYILSSLAWILACRAPPLPDLAKRRLAANTPLSFDFYNQAFIRSDVYWFYFSVASDIARLIFFFCYSYLDLNRTLVVVFPTLGVSSFLVWLISPRSLLFFHLWWDWSSLLFWL